MLVDMRSYTGLMVMWYLMTSCTDVSSVPGFRFTVRKLHQAAPLACEGKCPGALLWIRIQKPGGDVEVARCDQTSCSSVEGFIISHEQYLQGNFSLTITAADYRRRGWYTCSCDGQGLCDVSLRIEPLNFMKQVILGGSLVMDVQVPERVKVMFNRSSAEGLSSVSVPLCEVEGRKAQCDAEYEKRVKFECSLILHGVKETDRGVYTVQDTDNDETLYTLTLTGNKTEANNTFPEKGKQDSWNIKRIFTEEYRGIIVGLVLGLVLGLSVGWIVKWCGMIWGKVRRCLRDDEDLRQNDVKCGIVLAVKQDDDGDDGDDGND
ncbi:uncharacterized protein LOC124380743 isoform X2 [Silurus meridionalis]|uniref:uncharacterized protein LOC124380743 isoform X2 n=1 Tax=Silurus meridionalis TaxID=175797 RepID=UPI001EECBE87|nr:uncharacterized protein LOC124380743 isoform X2 [Silurus meridionalis]